MSESRRMIVLDGVGTEVEPAFLRVATDDEVRAAVVPLLDLEAAAIRYYEGDEIRPKPPYWEDCTDAMKGWYRDESKAIVYAALGLGEDE